MRDPADMIILFATAITAGREYAAAIEAPYVPIPPQTSPDRALAILASNQRISAIRTTGDAATTTSAAAYACARGLGWTPGGEFFKRTHDMTDEETLVEAAAYALAATT